MNISQLFKDDTGQISSMRTVFVLWGFGVFVIWAILSIMTKQLLAIPSGIMEILGICVSGKVIQSFSENNNSLNINQGATQPPVIINQGQTPPPGFVMGPPPNFVMPQQQPH